MINEVYVSLILFFLVFLMGILMFILSRRKEKSPDYPLLFFVGVIWIFLGIYFQNFLVLILGIFLVFIALSVIKDWVKIIERRRKHWRNLTKKDVFYYRVIKGFFVFFVLATLYLLALRIFSFI